MSTLPGKPVDPYLFARQGKTFEGVLKPGELARFRSSLFADEGDIRYRLSLGQDAQGIYYIEGESQATVGLECQRCLDKVEVNIEAQFRFGLLTPRQDESRLTEGYEALWVEEPGVSLRELLEDELMLALPLVPMHASTQCQPRLANQDEAEESVSDKPNPFAVLAGLKESLKDKE